MKSILKFSLCFILLTGWSQELPKVAPPAPEASSILKYAEVPVSYYTGIPNISVPLYTLEGRDLSAPVALSYHAGGHRVNEESTWIGLGWSLSAGGQITRTVRGFPDDSPSSGFVNTPDTVENVKNLCQAGNNSCGVLLGGVSGNATVDFEPDDFNFVMFGQSGRFMFSQDRSGAHPKGRIIQFPDQKMIIEPIFEDTGTFLHEFYGLLTNHRITGWIITDTSGLKYHFTKGDEVTMLQSASFSDGSGIDVNGASTTMSYIETWNLDRVESPHGDVITLNYHVHSNTNPQQEVSTTLASERILAWDGSQANNSAPSADPTPGTRTVAFSTANRRYTQLASIVSSKGRIEFIRSATNRLDTQTPKKSLDKIVVYNTANVAISEIDFIQDYFISPNEDLNGIQSYVAYSSNTNFLFKRLYLKNVIFKGLYGGHDANQDVKYSFSYDNTKLPHKRSYAQDHWGYFNNANNGGLVPYTTVNHPTQAGAYIAFGNANRDCNPSYSDACILKRITYPEGGRVSFTYENNRTKAIDAGGEYFGGLRVKEITTSNGIETIGKKTYAYDFGGFLSIPEYYTYEPATDNVGNPARKITFNSDTWVALLTTQHGALGYRKVYETLEGNTQGDILFGNPNANYLGYAKPKSPSYSKKTIVREYTQGQAFSTFIGAPFVGNWIGGKLKFEKIGTKSEKHIEYVDYSATTQGFTDYVDGLMINRNTQDWRIDNPIQYPCQSSSQPCDITPSIYKLWSGHRLPKKTTTIVNENGQDMVTTEETLYESAPTHYFPTKTITTNSNNDTYASVTNYSLDEIDVGLLNQNRISVPLRKIQYKNGSQLNETYTNYKVSNGNYMPWLIKSSKNTGASTSLENRIEYVSYTNYGQPREVKKTAGTSITYLWGYDYNYPVAKIVNATYAQVSALVNEQNLQTLTDDALHNALQPLRNGLPNAQIETFSYLPLIGLKQHRDVRPRQTFFHYDTQGRLQYVVDEEGHVVSKNTYNYSTN